MTITVTTVQHGFALEIGNKQWLLENEQELAETVVFRVAMGSKSDVTKRRMRMLLNLMMYGPRRSRGFRNGAHRSHGSHRFFDPTQSRRGRRNLGPQEEVSIN